MVEKIKNIEILRFLFIMCIVWFHSAWGILDNIQGYQSLIPGTKMAWLLCDCFFIMSGFFMFLKTDFNQSFLKFAGKKLIRFMPTIYFVLCLVWLASLFTPIKYYKYDSLFIVLNIHNIGVTDAPLTILPSWFVSALFWSMCFYFYMRKILSKQIFNLIVGCLIVICYSIFVKKNAAHWENFAGVLNFGIIRALAGLGVGYFLAELYKEYYGKIREYSPCVLQKLLITAAEIYLFCFMIYYSAFHKISFDNVLIMIIPFIGLFILFVLRKGYFSNLLNNNISAFWGQFTFSILISHELVKNLWSYFVCVKCHNIVLVHPILNLVLYLSTVILFGMITYYAVEKPSFKYLKNKFAL